MLDHGWTCVYFDGWLCLHWRRKPTTARTSGKTHEALKVGTGLVFTVTAPHPHTGMRHVEQLSKKGQRCSSGQVDLHCVLGSIHGTGKNITDVGHIFPSLASCPLNQKYQRPFSPLVLNEIIKKSKARDTCAFLCYNRG